MSASVQEHELYVINCKLFLSLHKRKISFPHGLESNTLSCSAAYVLSEKNKIVTSDIKVKNVYAIFLFINHSCNKRLIL